MNPAEMTGSAALLYLCLAVPALCFVGLAFFSIRWARKFRAERSRRWVEPCPPGLDDPD